MKELAKGFSAPELTEDWPVVEDLQHEVAVEFEQTLDAEFSRAVHETDWSETAVLRVVYRRPQLGTGIDELFGDLEVHRYSRRAPPISEHADGEHTSDVWTVTQPLIKRLGLDALLNE